MADQRQSTRAICSKPKGKAGDMIKRSPKHNSPQRGPEGTVSLQEKSICYSRLPLPRLFCTADEGKGHSRLEDGQPNHRNGKNTTKGRKGTWKRYEGSKYRPAYGPYSLCTADNSQTTADSQKRKELNKKMKDASMRTQIKGVCHSHFIERRASTADPYPHCIKAQHSSRSREVHHQPSGKLEGLHFSKKTRSAVMPPRSRRQNSVVNSHPDTESNAQNRAEGEMQQNNGGNVGGGGIPEGNQGGGNPGGQPPLTLIYELIQGLQQNQGELAESIRQLKESSNNREAHGGNGRNHEERDHHDERDSNNKNDAPFVTMSDVADLLKQERERPPKEPRHFGSAVEHISKFLDSMGPFAGNGGLCLREFSKSLVDRAYTWYAMLPEGSIRDWEDMVESFCSKYFHVEEKITLLNLHSTKQLPGEDLLKYIHRFRDISLDCHVKYEESELVEVCIDNMLPEFRAHLENLDISQFAPLLQKARKTALSVKPHSEKAREKKSQPQALTVSTTAAPTGNKRKRPTEKVFEEPPPLPFTVEEMMVIFDKWVKDETAGHYDGSLTGKSKDGTLQLSPEQQRVHKNPFPNHRKDKGKAVVSVVIQGSTSDMEVEESAVADTTLTPAAVRTLQKSPKFKSLFNQLGLGPEARNAATEAIIAIAADSGATCFTAEAHASRAFLETTNAVTFTDEDISRPPRSNIQTTVDPFITLKAANIPQHKIQGAPIEVTGFGGAAEYTMGHIQLVLRVGPIVALTRFHVVNSECIKGRLNGKPIRIAANPSPFDQTEAHFIEAALYDELSTEEPPIIKPSGTPLPDWEDIRNDPDVDLREVLERKKKRKERMAEEEDAPRCKEAESYKSLADEKEEAKLEEVCGREFKDNSQGRPGGPALLLKESKMLKEYQDVFAWKYDEMPGIDPGLVAHSLNVEPGTKPVVQPARTFHTEVEAQITPRSEEIACCRFHQANSTSTRWLSNIVPVKKKNGQIRCCVDFRNLNKACPKDEFPLPNMDLLIDSAAGSAMFSFMDGFSGYNQIRMSPRDAEKNCLPHAHRTMTAMFHDMIHQEIEDYVDDIVVKSKKREDHVEVLRKVFERCRLYKLKMNPLKCAFGVSAGKFLGFLVHNRGIDVDPAKASAIATMRPPTSHKELKSFLGRLSYIRRFIPGFGSSNFHLFTPPKKGSLLQLPLRLYLASNSQAIGALVAQENGHGVEQPVYYVSRGLKDTETRYSVAERACLALVYASQRLRHYFLAHKIQLMTKSHPIRSLLQRPVLSGRLAQWLLQLSQYEISTETPTAIKSQAIADLLAQFPGEDGSVISQEVPGEVGGALLVGMADSIWTLNFDGSSTSVSSGAGVVLTREDGETIAKSFKLNFPCSNNASEYEAYITGLAIAHEMGIKHLRVIGDSNLIVCQAKGEFSLKGTFSGTLSCTCPEDALAALGSQVAFEGPTADVTINKRSIPITELLREEYEEGGPDKEDWRAPLKSKLMSPKDVADLKALKDFVLISGDLYRRLPGGILARCVSHQEGTKKLQEVHEKSCELEGGVSLYRRLQRLGYFWPEMSKEAADLQRRCPTCQHQHENEQVCATFLSSDWRTPFLEYFIEGILPRTGVPWGSFEVSKSVRISNSDEGGPFRRMWGASGEEKNMATPWPFHTWGLDLIGPINPPSGGYIWILAATEYFTKWVEAIPLRKATGAAVANFIREHIITRFGIPHKIISDNGTPFVNKDVREVLEHYRIKHRRSTPYYPQGLEFPLGGCVMGLPRITQDSHWFHPILHLYMGLMLSHHLNYSYQALEFYKELEIEADVEICAEARVADLESLDEARELALARSLRYHQKLANAYGKTVHTRIFSQGQMVLKTADHVRRGLPSPSKFTPNWEGPYVIREAHDSGYYRLSKADGTILADPINGKWLKEYYS
uniref:Integrase catalytic domain-containing protein n=1 Tax=Fagus sylvatica TaxID=28930 RepID=A0A2N9IHQ7_FAGSY